MKKSSLNNLKHKIFVLIKIIWLKLQPSYTYKTLEKSYYVRKKIILYQEFASEDLKVQNSKIGG